VDGRAVNVGVRSINLDRRCCNNRALDQRAQPKLCLRYERPRRDGGRKQRAAPQMTSTPAPLYVCDSPLALVMTMVPGKKLNLYQETGDNMTPEVLESASRAVSAAMERYWSIESQLHCYLSFNNILCDIVARDLSNCFLCEEVTKRWDQASHDLAYLLYGTGVTVKNTIGHPGALLRRQMFTHGVLRAVIETIGPFEEKPQMLDEIRACAREHLKSRAGCGTCSSNKSPPAASTQSLVN
jgi:hypothetical protein